MKKVSTIIFALLFLAACEPEKPEMELPSSDIIDNLPISDRDLLLEPLERSMDDLAKSIVQDGSLEQQKLSWTADGISIKAEVYTNGSDTLAVMLKAEKAMTSESHSYFYNRNGAIFSSEHSFLNITAASGMEQSAKSYKFYYEDNGAPLSTYARMNFSTATLPEVWTPVCLTREEIQFLGNRSKQLLPSKVTAP